MSLIEISRELAQTVEALKFSPPVAYVYNPLVYAAEPAEDYLRRFGASKKRVFMLGMNPGPYGMVQTGVPFGDVIMVREWMGVRGYVGKPASEHPRKPVEGFSCRRREVSGMRLWGWAKETFKTADRFFEDYFVWNYCPLCFLEASGRNITPDVLRADEQKGLFRFCDDALALVLEELKPEVAVAIGTFAEKRLRSVLGAGEIKVIRIPHPSPANPQANQNWHTTVTTLLRPYLVSGKLDV